MRAVAALLLGVALLIVGQACVVAAQSTIPSFPPAPLPSGEPTQPTNPAAHGFYQPSQAAVNKLAKYTNIIELWFAGNSFDYLFGAYPGACGVQEYNAGVAAGKYTQQRYPNNAPTSFQVNTVYPQLPYDFQGCTDPNVNWPCASNFSYLALWAQSQNLTKLPLAPIEMSQILSLKNEIWYFGDPNEYVDYYAAADSGHWSTDPEHHFFDELYGLDGGLNDGFIFWGSYGVDYQVPGFPVYSERTGGTGFSYYNLSLPMNAGIDGGTIPYIYELAANYTLYDNFFKSVIGPSDIAFLAQAAGGLPKWGNSATACNNASDLMYGPQGAYQAVPCTYSNGFATLDSIRNCVTLADCTMVGEVDGYLPSTFPQPLNSINSLNLSNPNCALLGFAPSIFNTTANPISPGVYGFAPPLTSRSMFDELDDAGVNWAVYGKGLNSQINGNFCDPEWPNYSSHNNPLHYYANFSNPASPYFQQHLKDDSQFFSDLASGSLPAFSMLTMNEVYDGAVSDSDIGMMDSALIAHMNAIFASPGWKAGTTMVLVPFMDHGALWDHAATYAGDKTGPGARVPLIAISPDHAGGGINHYPYEHFSLRKMTQRRFGITNSIMSQTRLLAARDFTNSFDEANACYSNPCSTGSATGAVQCSNTYTPVTGAALCSSSPPGSSSTATTPAASSSSTAAPPAAGTSPSSAAAVPPSSSSAAPPPPAVSSSSTAGIPSKGNGAVGSFQSGQLSVGIAAACLLGLALTLLL